MSRTLVPRSLTFAFVLLLSSVAAGQRPMEGETFRCCTLIAEPLVFEDATSTEFGFGGISIEYIKRLQSELGFRCSSFKLFESDNVGFTFFIEHMRDCTNNETGTIDTSRPDCKCDIGATPFAINTQRIGKVDFVQPHVIDDYRVITHIDNTKVAGGDAFFLTSFSMSIWANIAALGAIFTLLKMLAPLVATPKGPDTCLGRPDMPRFPRTCKELVQDSRLPFRLRRASESTLYHLIGHTGGIECDSKTQRQRILNFTILLSGLFLALVYEAGMTAVLVRQSFQSQFRNLHDLQNCRILPEDVCLPTGGSTQAFWETGIAVRPCHHEPGRRGPTFVTSYDEMIRKVVKKECRFGVAGGSSISQASTGRYCQTLVETGRPFFEGGLGIVLPRGSPFKEMMDNATLKLQSDGALPSVEDYLSQQGECSVSTDNGLTFGRLRFFFVIAYIVCGVLLIEMIVALCMGDGRKPAEQERADDDGKADEADVGIKSAEGKQKGGSELGLPDSSPFSSADLEV